MPRRPPRRRFDSRTAGRVPRGSDRRVLRVAPHEPSARHRHQRMAKLIPVPTMPIRLTRLPRPHASAPHRNLVARASTRRFYWSPSELSCFSSSARPSLKAIGGSETDARGLPTVAGGGFTGRRLVLMVGLPREMEAHLSRMDGNRRREVASSRHIDGRGSNIHSYRRQDGPRCGQYTHARPEYGCRCGQYTLRRCRYTREASPIYSREAEIWMRRPPRWTLEPKISIHPAAGSSVQRNRR